MVARLVFGLGAISCVLFPVFMQGIVAFQQSPRLKVQSMAFASDGKVLAFGTNKNKILLYDAKTGARKSEVATDCVSVDSLQFLEDSGGILTIGSGNDVSLLSVDGNKLVRDFKGSAESRRLVVAPSKKEVFVGYLDGSIRCFTIGDAKQVWEAKPVLSSYRADAYVTALKCMPNGKQVISSHAGYRSPDDDPIHIWDAKSGKEACSFGKQAGFVYSVDVSPKDSVVAFGGDDRSVYLWDAEKNMKKAALTGHQRQVRSVCFSPSGKLLASAGFDPKVIVWNVAEERIAKVLDVPESGVIVLQFSPDETMLFASCNDMTIRVWNVDGWKDLRFFKEE